MKTRDHHLILRGLIYYVRARVQGRERWLSLSTGVVTVARARRDKMLEEMRGGRWQAVEALQARSPIAALDTIAAHYLKWAEGAKLRPRTARANVNAMRNLIRTTLGHELSDTPASALTADLLARYQAGAIGAARPLGPGAVNRALTSTHSIARQARSLFAARPMQRGAYEGLRLPDLEPFMRYSLDRGKIAKPKPAPEALLARTRQVAAAMRRRMPGHWLALQCAANIGMRRGEIEAACWDWFTASASADGAGLVYVQIGGRDDYEAKGSNHNVQLDPGLWAELQAARVDAGPYLLPGTPHERDETLRTLSRILRATGWTHRKPLHELRKQCGMRIADQHGPLAAKEALGHSDMRTTLTHYVTSLRPQAVRLL